MISTRPHTDPDPNPNPTHLQVYEGDVPPQYPDRLCVVDNLHAVPHGPRPLELGGLNGGLQRLPQAVRIGFLVALAVWGEGGGKDTT